MLNFFNDLQVKMRNPNGVYACEADDFLPLLAWVLVRCNVVTAELEAEYMEGLLHPSLMTGEGGYYLTTLCAAVQVVRSHRSSVDAEMIRSHNTVRTYMLQRAVLSKDN